MGIKTYTYISSIIRDFSVCTSHMNTLNKDFIVNFLKNIFTSVLAPQIAVASLGGPGMIRKENKCN